MIRKGDVQWWVLEVRKHPETASLAINVLAERLAELDSENERLRNELLRMQQRSSPETDSAEIRSLREQVARLQYLLDNQAVTEPVIVFLSDRMRAVRTSISKALELGQSEATPLDSRALLELRRILVARPHDELLILTSQGRGFKHLVPDLPLLTLKGDWTDAPGFMLENDRVATAIAVHHPPRFWTIATRKGYVQRFVRAAFERNMDRGVPLLQSLFERDEAVDIIDGERGDVVLITRWGYANRFSQRSIDVQGSSAIDLEAGDEIVTALPLTDDTEILVATASGYTIRRDTTQIPTRTKPGGTRGKRLIRAQDVLAAYPYAADDQILYLTYSGKLVIRSTSTIPATNRLGQGTLLQDLRRDPAAAIARIPRDLCP